VGKVPYFKESVLCVVRGGLVKISVLIQVNERRKERQVKGMWLWIAKGERAEKPAD
jgi:hypothetical protein